jgi:cation diffusion facilitator CzcD-associated flavoprotein CzcO
VIEAGSDVGGTWYWNRYPGARCDVPSIEYSYSFSRQLQQDWDWTEIMAGQPEILRYASHVADRFELRSDIEFDTRVSSAHFDEERRRWRITTEAGDRFDTRFCIMATGCLSTPNTPAIEGAEDFGGPVYHTGGWPHEGVDFAGVRVGIIGTGSSGVQAIPVLAEQAGHLTVFQRTPNYTMPAHNRAMNEESRQQA